jgi:hypothetical protein
MVERDDNCPKTLERDARPRSTTDRLLQDHALGEIVEELGTVALAVLLESRVEVNSDFNARSLRQAETT